jgi:hypothetical protein
MTNPMSPRDPDAILAAWLEDGPTQLPETTRRAIAVGLRSTSQTRRVLDVPWRPNVMNPFARLAVAAAAIVIVAGGALYLLAPGNQTIGGPSAAPSPSVVAPSASPSAQASVSPSQPVAWESFTSRRFAYTMEVPVGWVYSNPIDDLPDDLFPGEEIQYADRWDDPADRFPYFIVAVIDPAPEADSAWLERAVARLIADCDAADPVTVSVSGTTGERRRATCTDGLATEIVFFSQGVGSIDRIFMIESSAAPADAAPADAAIASEILDHILASFSFYGPA